MVSERALKDFEIYAQGVDRLHELKKELDALDTRKFRKQEESIRRKLKSVHLIPQIEFELKQLKARIVGIDLDYEKTRLDQKQDKVLRHLKQKEREINKGVKIIKKGLISDDESKEIEKIPKIEEKINSIKRIFESKAGKLEKEIFEEGRKNRLNQKELDEIKSLPHLKGKVEYLKQLLKQKSEQIEKEIHSAERKKQLSQNELKEVKEIPHIQGKVEYLKRLLKQKSEQLEKEIQSSEKKKQLSEEEIKEVNAIPRLRRSMNALRSLFRRESEELEHVEIRAGKIPALEKKLKTLSGVFGIRSEEIAKEAGDIEKIKYKLGSLKRELERKAEELEKELQIKTKSPAKAKIIGKIHELSEKMDRGREEMNKRFIEEMSDSKWMIENEKQNLRRELADIISESRWLIEKEAQEISKQLSNDMNKMNQKIDKNKEEINKELILKIANLKRELNVVKSELVYEKSKQKVSKKGDDYEIGEVVSVLAPAQNRKDSAFLSSNERFVQPFLPPPKFSPIKITPSKETKNLHPLEERMERREKVQPSKFLIPGPISLSSYDFEEKQQDDKSFWADDSDAPAFPSVPKMPKFEFNKKNPLPKSDFDNGVYTQEIKRTVEQPLSNIKMTVEMSKKKIDSYLAQEKKVVELQKIKPRRKSNLFLKVGEFFEAKNNFDEIENNAEEMEHHLQKEIQLKNTESQKISNLIAELEKSRESLLDIDKNLLKNIS